MSWHELEQWFEKAGLIATHLLDLALGPIIITWCDLDLQAYTAHHANAA